MLSRIGIRYLSSSSGAAARNSGEVKTVLPLGLGGGNSLSSTDNKPPPLPGGLTKEKLMAMLKQQNEELAEHGIEPTMLLLDHSQSETDISKTVVDALRGTDSCCDYDVVSIGAGVRTLPEHFLLFENLVNLVHEHAPDARIAFDTSPTDKVESILRNLKRNK
ncbi:MAG: hypothetical protein SGARI_001839 [Bacillariaceae sp.]